jgi:hypothetical protein
MLINVVQVGIGIFVYWYNVHWHIDVNYSDWYNESWYTVSYGWYKKSIVNMTIDINFVDAAKLEIVVFDYLWIGWNAGWCNDSSLLVGAPRFTSLETYSAGILSCQHL